MFVRVIMLDTPNLSISALENVIACSKTSLRISLVTLVDILVEQYPNMTVPQTPTMEIIDINAQFDHKKEVSFVFTP